MKIETKKLCLDIDFQKAVIKSLKINGIERLVAESILFKLQLRDKKGNTAILLANEAKTCILQDGYALYSDFSLVPELSVKVTLKQADEEAVWYIAVAPGNENYFVEWVDFPLLTLPKLQANNSNGTGGRILFPYNEGAIVSDMDYRESGPFKYAEASYPSRGNYSVFPNMIFAQMIAYLWDDCGLYIGAHDETRGVKEINFMKDKDGVTLKMRLWCGKNFGEKYDNGFPIVFSVTDNNWQSAAERYRSWFECTLPSGVVKINENKALPEWYADSPLIVTYPIRGTHDTDEMKPNKLYPYTNALPMIEELRELTKSRLLVLLMHWEGTAPWAPPYVWPPFGDVDNFDEFLKELHGKGDLLGVYCSGFGYTIQSKLISEYNKSDEYESKELWRGMCADVDGEVKLSKICTDQRSGYDICPASDLGKKILLEAYTPLLESDIDYVQILDQNHGGGQYFCYSREHGHPACPGEWMTENMKSLLADWKEIGKNKLLGCESAAAEPFIGSLLFSDNRYELNYLLGKPVPLYAYIYHEYIRNFMGNQICCALPQNSAGLAYRLAYSFSSGDAMTLVMSSEGKLVSQWGIRNFDQKIDREKIFKFISNLTDFYSNEGKKYLYSGRMINTPCVECDSISLSPSLSMPGILYSAWEAEDGSKALILVNPSDLETTCRVDGKSVLVTEMNAKLIMLT